MLLLMQREVRDTMDDITFQRGPARRPDAADALPVLQWATGLTTTQREVYAGWLVETGKHEDLDAAMTAAGFATVAIKHGNGNVVTHWRVEVADLFIAADGVQGLAEMKADPARYGVAFWWGTTEDGRARSQLRAQVFLRPLLDVGYTEPLLLSVKSTLTGDILAALMRVYDILDALDALRTAQGRPALNAPFYAVSLPIGAGAEVQRGATQKKGIVPPVALLPETLDGEWLVGQYIKAAWVATLEAATDRAVAWSTRISATGDELPSDTVTEEAAPIDFRRSPEALALSEAEARVYRDFPGLFATRTYESVAHWLGRDWVRSAWKPETVEDWQYIYEAVANQRAAA